MYNKVVQTTALSGIIVDDMTEDMVDYAVCSFCDDGGTVLSCKGECMRSFHATVDAGEVSGCVSLGLTKDEVQAVQNFFCKNCEYKQHQCFVCGKLGSSDKETGAEVFRCVSAICGHFYHPHCVSKLLFRDDQVAADQLRKSIIAGESFLCPLHKCNVCKHGENKEDSNLQFAVCRRCPKAYHRKCLPRKIAFEDKLEKGIETRAWKGLLPDHRILIYCLKHEIGPSIRDHIVFPGVEEKKTNIEGPRKKHASALRKKLNSELPSLDAASERRLLSLMKDAASSVSVEDILKKDKIPSTHAYSSKSVVDKGITLGKVEGSVEAIRTALKKLEVDGCSIEDAIAVSEPEILDQIFKWKNKLEGYLAPFLHGMRYSSFGRHFTKVDKLQEIVDKLHWYVKDGDMIVDFCCGANDFSCLMQKKLEKVGKKCLFKNFDIMPTTNDFNFEQRDWMTVTSKELASGSQMIMGLNPPFGVKAALANKFINKALEFKPKLLILVVPRETERLDRKKTPYELVWEDDMILSGKSFYLPGSVDVNDKQIEQWNLRTPPLYLWSRKDLVAQHKAVAEKHGHISEQQKQTWLQNNCYEAQVIDHLKEADRGATSMLIDLPLQTNEVRELRQEARVDEGGFYDNAVKRQDGCSQSHRNNQSSQKSSKRKHEDDDCQKFGNTLTKNGPGPASKEAKDTKKEKGCRVGKRDKSKMACYNCGRLGHFARDCIESKMTL